MPARPIQSVVTMDPSGGERASVKPPGKEPASPGGRPRRGLRLRLRLLMLIMLALLPSLALLIQTAVEERHVLATSVEDGVLRLTRPISSELERLLAGGRQLLFVLARSYEVRNRSPQSASALFADLQKRNPLYANIGAILPDGRVLASAVPVPKGTKVDLRERRYLRRAIATRDFAVGEFQIGRSTHKATINIAYPAIGPKGRVEAILIASLDLSYFEHYFADLQLPPGSTVMLLDRNGTVLARQPGHSNYIGTRQKDVPIVDEILHQQYGVIETTGVDGVDRIYAFAPIGETENGLPAAFVVVGVAHDQAYVRADAILARNLGLLAIVWSLLLAIVWFGTERLLMRPIDRLRAATRKLAAGDLDSRVGAPYNTDEIGELAQSFDAMAVNVQALTAQREDAVREEQAAQAEAQALKNLDRLRTQFVNAVSHELRIPLTSIIGYTEFLEDELGGPLTGKQAEFVAQVHQGAIRLARLVDDLLDYARIEAGTFALRVEPADFGAKVADILESFRPQAEDAGLELVADLPAAPLMVPMDSHRVGQMLSNLVGNAIKFTPPGGRVSVSVKADGRSVRCEIADDGPGIAPEDLGRLFKPFAQLPAGKKMGGTGLGLSITRSLAEAHGGRVGVASKVGEGSTFWFALPLERPESTQDRLSEHPEVEMSIGRRPLSVVNKNN